MIRRTGPDKIRPKQPKPVEFNPNMDVSMLPIEKRAVMYCEVRAKRLERQHAVDELAGLEGRLKESLIEDIEVGTGIIHANRAYVVNSKEKPVLEDWNVFIKGVVASGRYDMLQKRLADKAVMDTEDWAELPGVKRIYVKTLSVTKR